MKLLLFDDSRLGALRGDEVVDLSDLVDGHSTEPTSGWWRRLCRDLSERMPDLAEATARRDGVRLDGVSLRSPALNPSKVIAAAANYADHVAEMTQVQERTLGSVDANLLGFDLFLKAPSSVIGPEEQIRLPAHVRARGEEIHHECEMVIVIGKEGHDISSSEALEHVLGYTIGLDITVRSKADRSHRKSFDTFTPVGPWITTADEIGSTDDLRLQLRRNGDLCEDVLTGTMLVGVPDLIARASQIMTLYPGDLLFTGAPAGVGPIEPGDRLHASLSRVGEMTITVAS